MELLGWLNAASFLVTQPTATAEEEEEEEEISRPSPPPLHHAARFERSLGSLPPPLDLNKPARPPARFRFERSLPLNKNTVLAFGQ